MGRATHRSKVSKLKSTRKEADVREERKKKKLDHSLVLKERGKGPASDKKVRTSVERKNVQALSGAGRGITA